jgi:hypothetical protein
MATTLKNIIAYILKHYPKNIKGELSNARLTKIIYLADWHQAINKGKQITNINWYFDNYGPYVSDVKNEVESNPSIFRAVKTDNIFNTPKILMELADDKYEPDITEEQKESIDYVIEVTKKMYWDQFIKLVYSTYPISNSERYTFLDLLDMAKKYKPKD